MAMTTYSNVEQGAGARRPPGRRERGTSQGRSGGRERDRARDRRDWRTDVRAGAGLNLVAGAWLVAAPFVLSYATGLARWNDVVVGAAIAVLAVVRLARPGRTPELSWGNAALGFWLFALALWSHRSDSAMWNDIVLGAVVFVAAIVGASASEPARPVDPRERGSAPW